MGKSKPYRLGMYEKAMPSTLTFKEKLLCCKDCGFDFLEISIDETDEKLNRLNWSDEERTKLILEMREVGISIDTMCLSGHRKYPLGSSETEDRSLQIMTEAINLASDLGIRLIQLAGYDVYYEESSKETVDRFTTNLKKCAELAGRKGVILGFETMETPFMDTVEKSMKYVELVNSPYLGIYPDIGNLTNASLIYNVDVVEDIEKGKGHIFAAHLKETIPNHYREIPFGTGHTDFVKCISELNSLGVKMFTAEFWYVGQDDWKQTCIDASDFIRGKLDEVFNN